MTLSLCLLTAVAIDYCFGEPPNAYHPLVVFGHWANWLEQVFHQPSASSRRQRLNGLLAWLCALTPILLSLAALFLSAELQAFYSVIVLYFCIAPRSLQQHASAIYRSLKQRNLALARQRVGYIVSRETAQMDTLDVRRASVESILENGADAVFAPVFWFVVLGPIGALLYRLSNTLDAMWGYKNERYQAFGWAAARFDDALNWAPARLTALSYALLGNTRQAWHAWQNQACLLDSPNAGPVMTAGAGAMNIRLGGPARYHGTLKQKPWFGGQYTPIDEDIPRACKMIYQTLTLWLIVIATGDYLA